MQFFIENFVLSSKNHEKNYVFEKLFVLKIGIFLVYKKASLFVRE